MERRTAVKKIGLGISTFLALPSWANGWNKNQFEGESVGDLDLLGALVECIIPESDSPGALSIGAHLYINRMIKDCYDQEVQSLVNKGLENLNLKASKSFNTSFGALNLEDRMNVFSSF